MKVKHIITTCGIILGGLAVTNGANAIVTYKDGEDVQFSFAPVLSMSLSADGFTIDNLAPGTSGVSNAVTATVSTNSAAGYQLSATVGNSTYASTDLISSTGTGNFRMISSGTSLTSGTWGYTLDSGATYKALSITTPTVLNKTSDAAGTAASSAYAGGTSTAVKIGAYAATDQRSGTYNNVVNFAVVPNIAAHTVAVAAGAGVSSVTPAAASYVEGDQISIGATCASGYTFSNWANSTSYGTITDPGAASTTFTVGAGDTTLTAYCVSSS